MVLAYKADKDNKEFLADLIQSQLKSGKIPMYFSVLGVSERKPTGESLTPLLTQAEHHMRLEREQHIKLLPLTPVGSCKGRQRESS